MPFVMKWRIRQSSLAHSSWDGVIWYSPSIFHGPLAHMIMRSSKCKGYLIIRDIFPEWAVDIGLIRRGFAFLFFRAVAQYQYSVADVIGVQTKGNRHYFERWSEGENRKLEVLQNWLGQPRCKPCSLRISDTSLSFRKVLVYAGNMGVAQGMDIFIDLANQLQSQKEIGFLLIGRGSEVARLRSKALALKLDNLIFADEIDPDEIPDLYAQCSAGIVALDPRHKSHNIPGKFLTYMQNGLPVLANINADNDLKGLIEESKLGQVCESNQIGDLLEKTKMLLRQIETDADLSKRCRKFFEHEFAVEKAALQIVAALSSESS